MMVYVERNDDGAIIGVYTQPQARDQESVDDEDAEVVRFRASLDSIAALHDKRIAAEQALIHEQMMARALEPDAPQAIKDYANIVRATS